MPKLMKEGPFPDSGGGVYGVYKSKAIPDAEAAARFLSGDLEEDIQPSDVKLEYWDGSGGRGVGRPGRENHVLPRRCSAGASKLMTRPLLYDLYCGAGGATKGYQRAGFRVVGIDIMKQPRYCGDGFVEMDALEFLRRLMAGEYERPAAIHASPPCQAYSIANHAHRRGGAEYPDLVGSTRTMLASVGAPYIIENVVGAPLQDYVVLCGLSFGLAVLRHRLFESNVLLLAPPHESHRGKRVGIDYEIVVGGGAGSNSRKAIRKIFSVAGTAGKWRIWGDREISKGSIADWREAMGIEWMNRRELTQAIPPAYTEFLGRQLIQICAEGSQV